MLTETAELRLAHRAATRAGAVLMQHFGNDVLVRSKDSDASYNLVSDADVEAEQAIIETIAEVYPDHAIYGEEERRDALDAEHLWVVDPLDGTNNFLHNIPHFAVSIAYFHNGALECGAVLNPARDDRYAAIRGQGAEHNGRPIQVSPASSMNQVLAGVGFYYDRGEMMEATLAAIADFFRQHVHGIRRFGTAALDLCQVASGQFGGFMEFELSPWDFAAGWLIVKEAGGVITTCRGNSLGLAKSSVLASTPALHSQMLEIASRHIPAGLP